MGVWAPGGKCVLEKQNKKLEKNVEYVTKRKVKSTIYRTIKIYTIHKN